MNRTFLLPRGTVAGCLLALVLGCGGSKDDSDNADKAGTPAAPAPAEQEATEATEAPGAQPGIALPGAAKGAPDSVGKIGVKLPSSTLSRSRTKAGKAVRVELQPPLPAAGCSDRVQGGIAVVGDAAYFIEHGVGVRRYLMGATWTLDTTFGEAGILAHPVVAPITQPLGKGRFYARSGDAKYKFSRGPKGTLYIFDYIDGIHRIAGKGGFDSCTNVPGINALAWRGKRAIALRGKELFDVKPGKTCKLVAPRKMPVRASSFITLDGDIYVAGVAEGRKYRLVKLAGGKKAVFTAGGDEAFEPDGLCYAGALAEHAETVCVVDGNCNKVVCFDKSDGSPAGSYKNRDLFGGNPNKITGVQSHQNSLYFVVTMRDRLGETCQPTLFKLGSLHWGVRVGN